MMTGKRPRNGAIVPLTAAMIAEYLEFMAGKDHGDQGNEGKDERL